MSEVSKRKFSLKIVLILILVFFVLMIAGPLVYVKTAEIYANNKLQNIALNYAEKEYNGNFHVVSRKPEGSMFWNYHVEYQLENESGNTVNLDVYHEDRVIDHTSNSVESSFYGYIENIMQSHVEDISYHITVSAEGSDTVKYLTIEDLKKQDGSVDIDMSVTLQIYDYESPKKYYYIYQLYNDIAEIKFKKLEFTLAFPDYLISTDWYKDYDDEDQTGYFHYPLKKISVNGESQMTAFDEFFS